MSAAPDDAPTPEAEASGSSFYAGMRLLPKAEREAMYLIRITRTVRLEMPLSLACARR